MQWNETQVTWLSSGIYKSRDCTQKWIFYPSKQPSEKLYVHSNLAAITEHIFRCLFWNVLPLNYVFLLNILKLGPQRWIRCLQTASHQLEPSLENKVAKWRSDYFRLFFSFLADKMILMAISKESNKKTLNYRSWCEGCCVFKCIRASMLFSLITS